MKKLNVCVLFGGVTPEHERSLQSAEYALNCLDPEKYNIFPVGITKNGDWICYGSTDYSKLPSGEWLDCPDNRRAAISPVRGQGLLNFEGDCVVRELIDVVFPVLHGENGEDGAVQGLLQLADIPYVGSHISASAVAMDKSLTKLMADQAKVTQAAWMLVRNSDVCAAPDPVLDSLEEKFQYPMFVKPAGTGSCVGVSKAENRSELRDALLNAGTFDEKILVEEFIHGQEVEVAVMGNDSPVASICGEIVSGDEYITDTSAACIPAGISDDVAEQVRDAAVKIYRAVGCQGLGLVDFFVTHEDQQIVFNEINTLPGFSSASMFPKLFAASGIPGNELIDQLLQLALEAQK